MGPYPFALRCGDFLEKNQTAVNGIGGTAATIRANETIQSFKMILTTDNISRPNAAFGKMTSDILEKVWCWNDKTMGCCFDLQP